MKYSRQLLTFFVTCCALTVTTAQQIPFAEAKITQVVNDVSIIENTSLEKSVASLNQEFKAPDLLETGRRSRAELLAEDGTITRVGSNTLFSFEPTKREIQLKRGSVLFHSPEGKGGGQIVTDAATAAVVGTTIIVAATSDGGFKVLCLEGQARVRFANGTETMLKAGQVTFILPPKQQAGSSGRTGSGDTEAESDGSSESSTTTATTTSGTGGSSIETPAGEPGPVLNFDLDKMTTGSGLLNEFDTDLPSVEKIILEKGNQQARIKSGKLAETDTVIIGTTGDDDIVLVEASVVENAIEVSKSDSAQVRNALRRSVVLADANDVNNTNLMSTPTFISSDVDDFLGGSTPFGNTYVGIVADSIRFTESVFDISSLVSSENEGQFDIAASTVIEITSNNFYIRGTKEIDILRITTPFIDFGADNGSGDFITSLGHSDIYKTTLAVDLLGENPLEISDSYIFNNFGPLVFLARSGDVLFENMLIETSPFGGIFSSQNDSTTTNTPLVINTIDTITSESTTTESIVPVQTSYDPADITITAPGSLTFDNTFIVADGSSVRIGELEAAGAPTPERIIMDSCFIVSNRLKVIAQDSIALTNTAFGGVTEIRMSAGTVNLQDINFQSGSNVIIASNNGLLNLGSKRVNHVNFIKDVTYANEPAEYYVNEAALKNINTTEFPERTAMINISARQ